MRPAVTVLQLDTAFPRVPGDLGNAATFLGDIEILRISGARVGTIVSAIPAAIPMSPFEDALTRARGDVIVTSCGFLSYWQAHLAARTQRPFISSALTAVADLSHRLGARHILTLTYDAAALTADHFGPHRTDVAGLRADMHLRRVIAGDLKALDVDLATQEVAALAARHRKPQHRHIVLECTNLPPYKAAIAAATGLPITDILTCIEAVRPGTIRQEFLCHQEAL